MNRLLAGVGRADMTPPMGIAHVNWGARTHDRAEGIDLALWASVLMLEQGATRAAIVDLDFLLINTDECRRLRAIVARETGVAPDHVRLSFTHTHSGPPWATEGFGTQAQLPGMELVPAYREKVAAAIGAAARAAKAALRPAHVAAGLGRCDITVNRRLGLPDGRVVVGQNWEGYRDTALSVVRIDDDADVTIATIVGYGTHPIVLARDLIADLGAPRRMGTAIGLDAARLAMELRPRATRRRFDRVVESGAPLGIWVEDEIATPPPILAVESRRVALPVRNYGDVDSLVAESDRCAEAVRALDKSLATPAEIGAANFKAKRAAMSAHWARFCANRLEVGIELHGIRVGDAVLIGAPLEPFARIGVEIRADAALPLVHFGGYTNGWEGYVPNAEDFQSSGYEVEWATPYAATTAAVLVREARRLASDLAR